MSEIEDKVLNAINVIHKSKDDHKISHKRKRAPIGLNQAYTAGHVIQGHEEQVRRKEEEDRVNKIKKQAVESRKIEQQKLKNVRKEAQKEKRRESETKKLEKRK